uniref:CSON013744 protein n=1 Tax=Culicoides sonorensis TaxID=179676 RepID=A0A336KP76_CULSO
MRSDDKKLKSTAKDTHGLRLNLKSPENRQRYPPDETDLDAIQVISSEYEIVLPQLDKKNASTPISTVVPNVPPPPPFPPDGFLHKLSLPSINVQQKQKGKNDDDEMCLPKIKNKYGAVSKTYMKKLSSIFNQHPNSAKVIFDNNNDSIQNLNVNKSKIYDNKSNENEIEDEIEDEIDEGRGSLSEKSVKNDDESDKNIDENLNYHTQKNNNNMSDKNNKMHKKVNEKVDNEIKSGSTLMAPSNAKPQPNLDLGETIGTFTLPRIALNKTGATSNYEEDTARSTITPASIPASAVASHHQRNRRTSTSHYSTEKSGSSGYYGSNLYSAGGSSVDEHIYSEPVIIEHVQVHSAGTLGKGSVTGIVKKERKCLASLNKSITTLEICLDATQEKSQKISKTLPEVIVDSPKHNKGLDNDKKNDIPNSIVNRRKASLPRDETIPRPVWPGDTDDSLTNINLDAFNMKSTPSTHSNESFNLIQLNTPKAEKRESTFTNADSGKGTSEGTTDYMDLIDYHQTRNILVNIRGKLDILLEQHRMNTQSVGNPFVSESISHASGKSCSSVGVENDLEHNIISLKNDLENYLAVMTEKSEQELRQFSDTMSKDSRMQTVTKAFDRSKCRLEFDSVPRSRPVTAYTCYSSQITKTSLSRKPSIEKGDFIMTCNDQINPFTATPCDTVIQIISSENGSGGESSDSLNCDGNNNKPSAKPCNRHGNTLSQMQKNLAFSQLINDSFNCKSTKYGDDREKMLKEWHRDKPSIWEMYYGTNRYSSKIEQAMIREYRYGNKCAMNVSYVSN